MGQVLAGDKSRHVFAGPGTDRAALTKAIHSIDGDLKWEEVPPRLEDVFIHMLSAKGGEP